MIRLLPILALALLTPVMAWSQEAPLVTDRPNFTESAVVVPTGSFQIEAGYTMSRSDGDDEQTLGEVLARIGVAERVELRLEAPTYVWLDGGDEGQGFGAPGVGAKFVITEADAPHGTAFAVLVGTSLPVADDDVDVDEWQPGATASLAWDLSDRVALGVNAGYTYAHDGSDHFSQGSGSVAFGFGLSERAGAFLEAFAISPIDGSDEDDVSINGGFTFLADPLLQLDARIGAGLTDGAPDVFFGFGVARRW